MSKELIVKGNGLINASYNLSLAEQRIVLMAIVISRYNGKGINANDYLDISASDYSKNFKVDNSASYRALIEASKNLFERKFTITEQTPKGENKILSRWVSAIKYIPSCGTLQIIFAPPVIPFINDLEKKFTKFFLEDVADLQSKYALRLYEILMSWSSTKKTPPIAIEKLRSLLGVEKNEYPAMNNFKRRVLDLAVGQINEKTNIFVTYEQHKKGRSIDSISFSYVEISQGKDRDPNTVDWVDEQPKQKRKAISEYEASQMANPGEEWPELLKRIGSKYHVIFDKNE